MSKEYTIFDAIKVCYIKLCISHLQDPMKVCRSLFGQLSSRDHKNHAAEEIRLPDLEVSIIQ